MAQIAPTPGPELSDAGLAISFSNFYKDMQYVRGVAQPLLIPASGFPEWAVGSAELSADMAHCLASAYLELRESINHHTLDALDEENPFFRTLDHVLSYGLEDAFTEEGRLYERAYPDAVDEDEYDYGEENEYDYGDENEDD